MSNYGFLVGPYFLGFALVATALVLLTIWSARNIFVRGGAVLLYLLVIYSSVVAVEDLLSQPKPVTFAELQNEIPDGHSGHLVLYGEATEEGIYLLLRSPAHREPRYYFLAPPTKDSGKKMKESFENAQREANKKGTQLLLGGKSNAGKGDGKGNGKGKGKGKNGKGDGNGKGTGEEDVEMEAMFHPAPVSGGPEKDSKTPERSISIPTPAPALSPQDYEP